MINLESLSVEKALPADKLRDFGVSDQPGGGVRIEYVGPDGKPGRARYRGARGVDGSTWECSGLPVIAYWHVAASHPVYRRDVLLLCEGESSCWTLWHCGFAAVGIPGGDRAACLREIDVASAQTVLIVVEPDGPETYPLGRDNYAAQIVRQLDSIGYAGAVNTLYMDAHAADINELYQLDPSVFAERLDRIVDRALAER